MARTRPIPDPAASSGLRQLTWPAWLERFAASDADQALVHAHRLAGTVLLLMGFGLLLQASHASTTLAPEAFRADLVGELAVRALGLGGLFAAWWLGPTRLRPLLAPLVVVALGLLLCVWLPGIGREVNGSHRWLNLGLSVQPSELARVVLVLWVADRCVRAGPRLDSLVRGVLPMLPLCGLFFLAVVLQPDLGAALLLLSAAFATMWVGGVGLARVALPVVCVGAVAVLLMARFLPYVRGRIAMWQGDVHNEQVADSLSALTHAGPFGLGLAGGEMRNRGFNYMDSDFAFALVGEEFGLFGALLLVGLFAAFLWNSLRLVLALPRRFEAVAAFGLCFGVCLQALIHLQVNSGLAPPKGMTLPFVSAGGTSFLVSSVAVGLALGAARACADRSSTNSLGPDGGVER